MQALREDFLLLTKIQEETSEEKEKEGKTQHQRSDSCRPTDGRLRLTCQV